MLPLLKSDDPFPDLSQAFSAESDLPGLLAMSTHITPAQLKRAYTAGIFPWYSEGQPVLWWCTDPRMVLFVDEFKISKSFARVRKQFFATPDCCVKIDNDFAGVMRACAQAPRPGQNGTWITNEIIQAYTALHQQGLAHSLETWRGDKLIGGLYGVQLGCMFYGESMFSHEANASKIALSVLVQELKLQGGMLIDCQQETSHMAKLGARAVFRHEFIESMKTMQNKTPHCAWPKYVDSLSI